MPFKDKAKQAANHAAWRKKNRERLLREKRAWHASRRERRMEAMQEYNHAVVLPNYHQQRQADEQLKALQAISALVD